MIWLIALCFLLIIAAFTLVILHIVYTVQKLKDARQVDARLSRRVFKNSEDIRALQYNVSVIKSSDLPKMREQQEAHEKRTTALERTSKSQQDDVSQLKTDVLATNKIASGSLAKANELRTDFDMASLVIAQAATFLEDQFQTMTESLTSLKTQATNADSSLSLLKTSDAGQTKNIESIGTMVNVPEKKITASSLCLDAACISAAQLKQLTATVAFQQKLATEPSPTTEPSPLVPTTQPVATTTQPVATTTQPVATTPTM